MTAGLILWRTRELKAHARELKVEVQARTHELELANEALESAANHDFLTGLPNRRAFFESLERLFSGNEPLAMAMIDIDHFKAYNDALGHVAGDRCLVEFAKLLEAQANPQVQAARIGGEEFALVFSADAVATAGRRLDDLAALLRERAISHPASPLRSTVSFSAGLALRHRGDTEVQDLIRRADEALYRAKDEGRNRWTRSD